MTEQEKELVVLGCYIRVKLDTLGFDGYLSSSDVTTHLEHNKISISSEIASPMKRFVEIFEELD